MDKVILPPAMLGVLGGGQLGSMFVVAAKTMGYRVTVLDPDPNAPAARMADRYICAPFDDDDALNELAKCAAVTTEFENVNADAMRRLAMYTRVSPSGDSVAIAQNRIAEKACIRSAGLKTVNYKEIYSDKDMDDSCMVLLPAIIKTAMLGYDGKGQVRVQTLDEAREALTGLGGVPCVMEQMVDLRSEISVVVCRLDSEHIVAFDAAENYHENGILAYSIVPARLPESLQEKARQIAICLAESLDYVGVLAVEMFVVGDDQDLLVNEIAPRPHNSGHHTLDACMTSQFQQQVRLMCGLSPADTRLLSPCCMANILGDVWGEENVEPDWLSVLCQKNAYLHQYGKLHARAGRKMGHFTVLANDADAAFETARMMHNGLKR